jgi:hypothetical protein
MAKGIFPLLRHYPMIGLLLLLLPMALNAESAAPDTTFTAKTDTIKTTWTKRVWSEKGEMTVHAETKKEGSSMTLRAKKKVTLIAFLGVVAFVFSIGMVYYTFIW